MIAFKSNYYVFWELLKPNEKYKVSFEYNGVASDISHISPQCGCTAEVDKKDGIITAVYTENVAAGVDNETSASIYPNGIVPFQKNINVFVEDKEVKLTAKEYDLLELLSFHPNKVYSRENLLNIVWGYDYPGDVRTVDVHIRRLREKIEKNPGEPLYIHTKWGVGYYFQD